jgi:hypothetical protein
MVRLVRHRPTTGAETDRPRLRPPRHILTLPSADNRRCGRSDALSVIFTLTAAWSFWGSGLGRLLRLADLRTPRRHRARATQGWPRMRRPLSRRRDPASAYGCRDRPRHPSLLGQLWTRVPNGKLSARTRVQPAALGLFVPQSTGDLLGLPWGRTPHAAGRWTLHGPSAELRFSRDGLRRRRVRVYRAAGAGRVRERTRGEPVTGQVATNPTVPLA